MMLMLLSMLACVNKIVDRMTVDQVLREGQTFADTQKACALGESLSHVLYATGKENKRPDLALIIGHGTSALCAQEEAWQYELTKAKTTKNLPLDASYRIAEIKDAKIQAQRRHSLTAQRFYLAFQSAEAAFGTFGEECPQLKEKDETAYLVALISGTLAVLHDKAGGGQNAVPLNILPKIGRAAVCLDNEKWWNVPNTLQNGIWATIPGIGPEGQDYWATMQEEASKGAASGVRVAWAITALLAANADQNEILRNSIQSHGDSITETKMNQEWAFFDTYALQVSLQQSDLLWIKEEGYRTPQFGQLPVTQPIETTKPTEDPFGADPFQ